MTFYNAVSKTAQNTVRSGGVGYSYGGLVPNVGFLPVVYKNFNGGELGQSAQSEFDDGGANGVYANEYSIDGSMYLNTTASAAIENTFLFGGYINLTQPLVQGDEIWISVMVRPNDAFWTDTDAAGHLKFLRLRENNSDGSGAGHNDIYIANSGDLKYIKEGVDAWRYAPTGAGTMTVGEWQRVEFYLKLHSEPGQARIRLWRNDVLLIDDDKENMLTSTGRSTEFLLFTFWNSPPYPVSPHTVGVDNLVIATNSNPPTNTDSSGNIFIGDY